MGGAGGGEGGGRVWQVGVLVLGWEWGD